MTTSSPESSHALPNTSRGFSSIILAAGDQSSLREISDHETNLLRQKRPHRKSRNGCMSCKRRRVKCDERIPACSNCVKRHAKCDYPTSAQPALSSSSPLSQTVPVSRNFLESTSPVVNLLQMRLFHHFATSTFQTLAFKEVWKEAIVLAYDHEHLMHAILCLAARHLSCLSPEETSYRTAAMTHLSQASRSYREALSQPFTESNIDPLMCTATLLYYDSWTNLDLVSSDRSVDFNKDHLFTFGPGLQQIFMNAIPLLTRGPSVFAQTIRHHPRRTLQEALTAFHLDSAEYRSFFADCYDNPLTSTAMELPPLMRASNSQNTNWLSCATYESTDDPREAYMRTASRLSMLLALLSEARGLFLTENSAFLFDLSRIFFSFPLLCHQAFVQMLQDGNPRALLLMYHFYHAAKILLPKEHCWWAWTRAEVLERSLKEILIDLRQHG